MIDKARNWKSSLNLQRRAEIYILVTAHIFLFSPPAVLCSITTSLAHSQKSLGQWLLLTEQ